MNSVFRSRLFQIGLLLRVALLPFFGSYYLKELFIPFLDTTIVNVGTNPWSLLPAHYFPYGSFLLFLLFVPKFIGYQIFGGLSLGAGALSLSLMKLPLLTFDILLLRSLCHFSKERTKSILLFYWLNPIAVYITYVHGQLDVVAMSLCVLSVIQLTQGQTFRSATTMALATLCKFHVVVVVPFLLAYIWNRYFSNSAIRRIGLWFGVWVSLSVAGFLPLLSAGKLLYASTTSPEALRMFAAHINLGSGQVLYLGVLLVLAVLGRLVLSTRITNQGLFFGCGVLFSSLLLGTNTMPGWYYWVLPFFSLFFALYLNVPLLLFQLFVFLYLIHFCCLTWFLPNGNIFLGITYTLLQTSLLGIATAIWKLVISREALLQGRAKPVVIGLAGNSGSGKNRLTQVLQDLFNLDRTLVIEGDDYHKWERTNTRWQDYTHLNPRANHLSTMADHVLSLSKGACIIKPHYDHETGAFTQPIEVKPNKTVIIQGLHTLYLRGMRAMFDLKVFLAPQETVRVAWKIDRDMKERGHPLEKIMKSLGARAQDSKTHIDPQRQHADWIIEYFAESDLPLEEILKGAPRNLGVRHTIWNDAPIVPLIEALNATQTCSAKWVALPDTIDRTVIEIKGNPPSTLVEEIANSIFPNMRHITRGWKKPQWHGGLEGITQLIAVALLEGRLLQETSS